MATKEKAINKTQSADELQQHLLDLRSSLSRISYAAFGVTSPARSLCSAARSKGRRT